MVIGHSNITIWTDHKPLVSINQKELHKVPKRLQNMIMRIMKYNVKITYVPGKQLYVADTLSRAYLNVDNTDCKSKYDYAIHSFINDMPIASKKLQLLKEMTKEDPVLVLIINFCQTQWPKNNKNLSPNVKKYWSVKDYLTTAENLLFLHNKIVVPSKLRNEMLMQIHEGHCGIEKCKSRARQLLYWPNMNQDIEMYIRKCKICEKFAYKNPKEKLKSYSIPKRPWERIGSDIFSYGNHSYLVVFDAYSNWLELVTINNKSAKEVIKKLKSIFSKFGCPDYCVCDNVPFSSFEFKQFADEWNFEVVLRSPNYPRSNGLAEKGVNISKRIIKKCREENKDIYAALLAYRNSPLKHMNLSPAQLLMNRICKTKLPSTTEVLAPAINDDVQRKLVKKQNLNKFYYNQHSKELDVLNPNDNVLLYSHLRKQWEPGKIVNHHETPRSYVVKDEYDNLFRRNRIDLRKSLNEPLSKSTLEFADDSHDDTQNPNIVQTVDDKTNVEYVTRSGRSVRLPSKLNDFVC